MPRLGEAVNEKAMFSSVATLIQQAYITGWIVAAPIGPVNLEIIRRSLRHRLRDGFFLGLGAVTVDVAYLTLFSVGLGAFLRIPIVSTILYIAGGLFLSLLGVWALIDGRAFLRGKKRALQSEGKESRLMGKGFLPNYTVGLLMTGTNPMTLGFWSALSLQFASLSLGGRFVASAALFAGCFSWVLTLIIILRFARSWIGPRLFGIVTCAGGFCLLYFGLRFLAQGAGLDALFLRFT